MRYRSTFVHFDPKSIAKSAILGQKSLNMPQYCSIYALKQIQSAIEAHLCILTQIQLLNQQYKVKRIYRCADIAPFTHLNTYN